MDQNLGDTNLFLGTLRKMVSLFPCCSEAALTSSAWLFAVEEKQPDKKSLCAQSSSCSVIRSVLCSDLLPSACDYQPISLSVMSCTWGVPQPMSGYEHACCIPGMWTGGFPPKIWQRKVTNLWAIPAQSSDRPYICTVLSFTAGSTSLYTHFIWACNSTGEKDNIMLHCPW